MNERIIKTRLLILATLVAFALTAWWPELAPGFQTEACDPELLCVVFLDVGQGDSIFIQSPSGVQLIIDGGPDDSLTSELSAVMDYFDRDIDYLLITHPDSDHVSGFVSVLTRYQVDRVIRTENESDTATWRSLETAIAEEQAEVSYASRGQQYDLGGGVVLEILFPDVDTTEMESNMASIVARLSYGDTSFMLTGDAPKSIEEYLVLIEGEHLKSDVLKAGHHGSRTSTSELFLEHVEPEYAVISAGKDNSYGHPHVEVTDLLFNADIKAFNTGEQGRVIFTSDGMEVMPK